MRKNQGYYHALSVPMASVPEGGLFGVAIYTLALKGGRVRIYRDDMRRRRGRSHVNPKAGKLKYASHAQAMADLPRVRRALACALIASVIRAPWETSWSEGSTVHSPAEQIGFWTAQVRSGRLSPGQLEAVFTLFQNVPELGGPNRALTMSYLEQHHQVEVGPIAIEAAATGSTDAGACGLPHCIHRDLLLDKATSTPSGIDWRDDLGSMLKMMVHLARPKPCTTLARWAGTPSTASDRRSGEAAEVDGCAGLVFIEQTFTEALEGVLRRAIDERTGWYYAWPAEPSEVDALRMLALKTTRKLLLMGASGASDPSVQLVIEQGIQELKQELEYILNQRNYYDY
ncbi:MAG: hypothetical protein AAFX99_08500 [Myxococcota bacterium]